MSDKTQDVMSFRDYIIQMGGSGVIFHDECKEIMETWKTADWIHVDDYIAPIVAELIVETSDEHRELYEKMMTVIIDVYQKLGKRTRYKPDPDKPTLTRIK